MNKKRKKLYEEAAKELGVRYIRPAKNPEERWAEIRSILDAPLPQSKTAKGAKRTVQQ